MLAGIRDDRVDTPAVPVSTAVLEEYDLWAVYAISACGYDWVMTQTPWMKLGEYCHRGIN